MIWKVKMRRITRIEQVAAWRLCMGCGICASVCKQGAIALVDIVDEGLRPSVDASKCAGCRDCLRVCPGVSVVHDSFPEGCLEELRRSWGPVLDVWEGYAGDDEIRFKASSGGALTAIALYCLEEGAVDGVLHIGSDRLVPWRNVPVVSMTRDDLIARTGSRYSPAAPGAALDQIKQSQGQWLFIGKPCDVEALRKAQAMDEQLREKIALVMSFCCAGTPTTAGTFKLMEKLGVRAGEVEHLRYRGCGWPGNATIRVKDVGEVREMSYQDSWGNILSRFGQTRCRLCPDPTGEFADIACGDPWYRQPEPSDPGRSLIMVRTECGRVFLRRALEAGYLIADKADPGILPRSQKALLRRRRHLFGRLLALRLIGVPTPTLRGFSLYSNWRQLSLIEKGKTVAGTLKRAILRRWYRPVDKRRAVSADVAGL